MSGTGLKPCPFCNCGDIEVDDEWGIYCNDCGWGIPYDNKSKRSTVRKWNTRPIEDALRAEIAALKEESARIRAFDGARSTL